MTTTITFNCRGITFVPSPNLQSVYANAALRAQRSGRIHIESVDLFAAIYQCADRQTTEFLQMAIPQDAVDAAIVKHWSNSMAQYQGNGSLGASALKALATTAELGVRYRGLVDNDVGLITSLDLAIALLNDDDIKRALSQAGVSAYRVRHLEEALRLNEVVISDAEAHGAHSNPKAH